MNKLYMMVGLPASGKSTIAKEIAKSKKAIIVSSDELRKELLGDINEQSQNAKIFEEVEKRIKEGLKQGNVVYDACNINYKKRRAFLQKLNKMVVEKGEKKINAGMLYPHDIVHKYTQGSYYGTINIDTTLEELWKSLPVKEIENTLVVADGSGSMTSSVGSVGVTALDVANALAIYFAEHNKGQFKDKYITFSENPQYVDFVGCTSLRDKIRKALSYSEVANTNIEKVFKLILETGKKYKLTQEEMPKNILIISDMEFDWAIDGDCNLRLFDNISKFYAVEGYKLPRLIFWNVDSRTGTIPVKENELGVALVSGFSTNIAEMVMSGELDPLKVLLKKLGTERYKKIAEILAE